MLIGKVIESTPHAERAGSSFLVSSSVSWLNNDKTISIAQCKFDNTKFSNCLFEQYDLRPTSSISNAVDKRKAEYLAGRYTAKKALSLFNIEVTDIPVGKHRKPVFPANILCSISHTENYAVSVAAKSQTMKHLGVDLENWVDNAIVEQIKSIVVSRAEEKLLKDIDLNFNRGFTLVYSAKESIFKALYPSVGQYFDFGCARLVEYCLSRKMLKFKLTNDLSKSYVKERR